MALPELTLPEATPAFLADGHNIELAPMYADVPMRTGHDRRRRLYTVTPRIVNVGLQLTAAQMLAFHTWFEEPLQAGVQWFSAPVANQGPGVLWWQARFAEPYSADAGAAGASFKVNARLLLVGTGSATMPYTPAMQASALLDLSGVALLTAANNLVAVTSVSLFSANGLAANSVVALQLPALELAADTSVALLSAIMLSAASVLALKSARLASQVVRMNAAGNCTESGDASGGWNYTATGTGFTSGAMLEFSFPAGGNCSIELTVAHTVASPLNTVMGFNASATYTYDVGAIQFGLWVHQDGTLYRVEGGTYTGTGQAVLRGDTVRLTRPTPSTIVIAIDIGSTDRWTDVYTFTAVSSGDLHIWINMANPGATAFNLRGRNLIQP